LQKFGNIKILQKRANSTAWFEISWPAKNWALIVSRFLELLSFSAELPDLAVNPCICQLMMMMMMMMKDE